MKKKNRKTAAAYTVINGCDTADGKRYEIGDVYDPANHADGVTAALIEMNCLDPQEPAASDTDSEDE